MNLQDLPAKKRDEGFLHPRTYAILAIVIVAAALRIMPHPMNVTPVGALALFSGAYFSRRSSALVVSLLSLVIGDIFVGFHPLMAYVYAGFLISIAIGFSLRHVRSVARVGAATLAGALQFFIITNFAVWISSIGSYPKTASGLISCYIAGIPLFWNTLAGDSFYVLLFFGGMALAQRTFPAIREAAL